MKVFSRGLAAALLLGLLTGFAGAEVLLAASPTPVAPLSAPVSTSDPVAPGVEVTPAPALQPQTTDPTTAPVLAQPTSQPAAAPVAPQVTAAPRPTVPVEPPTTATPSNDVHSIAPEPGMPGYSPPPGRD